MNTRTCSGKPVSRRVAGFDALPWSLIKMDLSIVVSSKNRQEDVGRLLHSLQSVQVSDGRKWELVFVDNDSGDDTARVVQEFAPLSRFPIRYVLERGRGKSRGVNAGINLSHGRYIALTDDDAIVPSDWVERIIDYLDANPAVSCVGGKVKPFSPDIANLSLRVSDISELVDAETFAVTSIPVIGCNMTIRRRVFEKIGLFDVDLGPGSAARSAEDLDLLYRVINAGFQIAYEPSIWVHHNHERRDASVVEAVKDAYRLGRGAYYAKFILAGDRRVLRWAYWELRNQLARRDEQGWRTLRWLLKGALGYMLHPRKGHPGLGEIR